MSATSSARARPTPFALHAARRVGGGDARVPGRAGGRAASRRRSAELAAADARGACAAVGVGEIAGEEPARRFAWPTRRRRRSPRARRAGCPPRWVPAAATRRRRGRRRRAAQRCGRRGRARRTLRRAGAARSSRASAPAPARITATATANSRRRSRIAQRPVQEQRAGDRSRPRRPRRRGCAGARAARGRGASRPRARRAATARRLRARVVRGAARSTAAGGLGAIGSAGWRRRVLCGCSPPRPVGPPPARRWCARRGEPHGERSLAVARAAGLSAGGGVVALRGRRARSRPWRRCPSREAGLPVSALSWRPLSSCRAAAGASRRARRTGGWRRRRRAARRSSVASVRRSRRRWWRRRGGR